MENSPLSKLSAELRNTIAEMALHCEGGITTNGKDNSKFRNASALAHTCKEMREDYGTLFFNVNDFTHHANGDGFTDELDKFQQIIGPVNSLAISALTVSLVVRIGVLYYRSSVPASVKLYKTIEELSTYRDRWWLARSPVSKLRLELFRGSTQVSSEFLVRQNDPWISLREAQKSVEKELQILGSSDHTPPSFNESLRDRRLRDERLRDICRCLKDAEEMHRTSKARAEEYEKNERACKKWEYEQAAGTSEPKE